MKIMGFILFKSFFYFRWFKCIQSATESQKNSSHNKQNLIGGSSAAASASSTAASTPSTTGTSSTTTTTTTTVSAAAASAPADKLNKTDSIDTEQIQNTSTLKYVFFSSKIYFLCCLDLKYAQTKLHWSFYFHT